MFFQPPTIRIHALKLATVYQYCSTPAKTFLVLWSQNRPLLLILPRAVIFLGPLGAVTFSWYGCNYVKIKTKPCLNSCKLSYLGAQFRKCKLPLTRKEFKCTIMEQTYQATYKNSLTFEPDISQRISVSCVLFFLMQKRKNLLVYWIQVELKQCLWRFLSKSTNLSIFET